MERFYQKTKAIITLTLIAISMTVQASFVRNVPSEIKQPDGVVLHVLASGDEHYNWLHDQNNFTIVKNKATGYYVYATKVNGLLEPTNYVVGKVDPAQVGLIAGVLDDEAVIKSKAAKVAQRRTSKSTGRTAGDPQIREAKGVYNNIVVYIQFSDQVSEPWTLTQAEANSRFNGTGVVSVKDFYNEVSAGQLTVNTTFYPQTNNVYPISYTDSHTRSYYQKDTPDGYGNDPDGSYRREHQLIKNAIDYVSSQVPSSLVIDGNGDGYVDNVVFVIKGYTEGWAELLWPHRWSVWSRNDVFIGTKQVYDYNIVFGTSLGVGVISHELFHSFGAPDLYQYTSWNNIGTAVGSWDLMCSESWETPQHMSAYMKQKYGTWMASIPELTASGTYTLQPFSTNTLSSYKIKLANTDDYLVLEYRKQEGKYEVMIPGSGLIVSLIHPNGNNASGPVNEVYVFRKDGTFTNGGSIYDAAFAPDNGRTSFNDVSSPACFKSDGTPCGLGNLGISNVSVSGSTLTFNYTAPGNTTCNVPAWVATTAYTGGAEVSYNGNKYRARWWTQNNQPDLNSGSGQYWELLGPCGSTNVAPAVSITSPAANSTFAFGTTVTIVAAASDADGSIARVEFLNAANQIAFADDTAPYQYALTNLNAGTYTYKAVAYDNAGAVSNQATVSFTISNPTTVPTISITSPTEGQVIYQYPTTASPINVLVTTNNSAQVRIDSVRYTVVETSCNGPGCNTVTRYTKTAAPFTLTYNSIVSVNGFTQVSATAFASGVASEQSQVTYYVKPLPEVSIVSPLDNSSIATNVTSFLVDVDVSISKVAIDSVVYTVYDTKTTGMNGVITTRKFKQTAAPFDLTLPVIADKTYSKIFVLAYGDNGKFSESKSITVNYNNKPTVVITAPALNTRFNVGSSITIKANVTDSDGTIAKVEFYSPHIPGTTFVVTAPPYEATFTNLETTGNRGATSFVVVATDNRGGVNGASIDVIENKSPVITVTAPLPKYSNSAVIFAPGSAVTVSANVIDNGGSVAKVEISYANGTPVTKTAAPYTATFNNVQTTSPDGSTYFTVKAYDNEGGTSTALIAAYKNRLPNVAITSPANGSSAAPGSTITITTLTGDADGVVSKVEFFNGVTKLGESTTAPFSFAIANAAAGTYSLTAKATDDLGQSTTSSAVTVTLAAASCTVPAWNPSTAYTTGVRVSKGGKVYEAKWWSQNLDPVTHSGTDGDWRLIGPCNARLADADALNAVVVSPVPFDNELFISLTEANAQVQVYDLFGKKVAEGEGRDFITLNTSTLAVGLYLCKVSVNGESKSFTIIKR